MAALPALSAQAGAERTFVRPFRHEDIPGVVALRLLAFRHSERPADTLAAYVERIFFHNPWSGDGLASLVLDDGDGGVAGFVGILPRRMVLGDRPLRVAVATQLMVAPQHRGLAGRRLARAALAGPQDLLLSDAANDGARRIFESIGGATALAYSLTWTRALRPARYALSRRPREGMARVAARAVRPLCTAVDAVGRALGTGRSAAGPSDLVEPCDAPRQLDEVAMLLARWKLRPRYDPASLRWLLREVARKPGLGSLQQLLVRDDAGSPLGWCLYGGNCGGVGDVIQLVSRRGATARVLRRVFEHARRHGLLALTGRVQPGAVQGLADAGCVITREEPWTLAHSRHADVTDALERGDACIGRLDGEWWLSF